MSKKKPANDHSVRFFPIGFQEAVLTPKRAFAQFARKLVLLRPGFFMRFRKESRVEKTPFANNPKTPVSTSAQIGFCAKDPLSNRNTQVP